MGDGNTTALTYYLKIRALSIIPFKITTELAVLQIQTQKIKIHKKCKVTYISAFCMQTTAQANLCNSPPERSSTFRSLR